MHKVGDRDRLSFRNFGIVLFRLFTGMFFFCGEKSNNLLSIFGLKEIPIKIV